MGRTVLAVLIGAALAATSVEAQDRFEVSVFAGSYRGASNLIDIPGLTVQQQAGPIVGLRGTYWISASVGVAGSFAYAGSDALVNDQFPPEDQSTSVLIGTATAVWRFADLGNAATLAARGGVGIIGRNGGIWESGRVSPTTSLAGVLGANIRLAVTSWLELSVDGEMLLYQPRFTVDGLETQSPFQIDPVLSLGASTTF